MRARAAYALLSVLGPVALSWGSAVGGSKKSEIYATVVGR